MSGAIVNEDPTLFPPNEMGTVEDASGAELGQATSGLTFVAVSQATVVGTIIDPWQPEGAQHLAGAGSADASVVGRSALTLINPEGAFTACPDATLGEGFEVYAVVGRMTMDADRVMSEPLYAWSEILAP